MSLADFNMENLLGSPIFIHLRRITPSTASDVVPRRRLSRKDIFYVSAASWTIAWVTHVCPRAKRVGVKLSAMAYN